MALSKQDILEADDRGELGEVEVPEWGGTVYIGQMTAKERDWLESSTYDIDAKGSVKDMRMEGYRARIVALTACDEDGERLFEPRDHNKISQKSAKAVDRVFEEAAKVNGLSQEDIDETVGK